MSSVPAGRPEVPEPGEEGPRGGRMPNVGGLKGPGLTVPWVHRAMGAAAAWEMQVGGWKEFAP